MYVRMYQIDKLIQNKIKINLFFFIKFIATLVLFYKL